MLQLDLFGDLERPNTPPKAAVLGKRQTACEQLDRSSKTSAVPTVTPTLADVIYAFADDVSEHHRRVEYRSSLNRLSAVLQRPLGALPADPALLRPMIASANPALVGIKPANWKHVRSAVNAALRDFGVQIIPSRDPTPVGEPWAPLYKALPERNLVIGLSKLLRHFSRRGVLPSSVDVADFEVFREELLGLSTSGNNARSYSKAVRCWNCARSIVVGWPAVHVKVPEDQRRYSLDWAEFPHSFHDEVERYLAAKRDPDPFADDYAKPTRVGTEGNRRRHIRQIASAAVLSGAVPIGGVVSLAVLCDIANVKAALAYIRNRSAEKKVTEALVNLAYTLRTVAIYWLKDKACGEQLKDLIKALSNHVENGSGIRPKNRQRLRQFDLGENVEALAHLPLQIFRTTPKNATYLECVRLMYGLMAGILMFVPIRSHNLIQLQLGVHIFDEGRGGKRSIRIFLPGSITKTNVDYEALVPTHLYPLLDAWVNLYRSRVCQVQSSFLFPAPNGRMRSRDAFSQKLASFLQREIGLSVNPHLFRHIAAKLYLRENPDGIEVVRQLLGHTSIRTTLRAYAEMQTDHAFKRLEAAVLGGTPVKPR